MYEGRISAVLEGDAINRENISAASMPVNSMPQKDIENREAGAKV